MLPVIGIAQTFVVQTYRHREQGDTIFLETITEADALGRAAGSMARPRDASC